MEKLGAIERAGQVRWGGMRSSLSLYFILKMESALRAVRLGGAGWSISGPLIRGQNDLGGKSLEQG